MYVYNIAIMLTYVWVWVRDYENWGGGGAVRFRSDTFVWHTENTLSLIINGYNFDQGRGGGGGGAQALHTRANELNCRF